MSRVSLTRGVVVAAAMGAAVLAPGRPALAWSQQGHRVIALIADAVLQKTDPAARAKLNAVLATDKASKATKNDIASEAVWPDILREKSEEARNATAAWHAVRFHRESPDIRRDCFGRKPLPEGYPASHGPSDNCVVDKVLQFRAELRNPETSSFERLAAVQYLLNLVGDLNDPLNAIERSDRGGECVGLQIGSKPPVRLSTYWQTDLVTEVLAGDPAKAGPRLAGEIPPTDAHKWGEGDPESWGEDSYAVAKTVVYSFMTEKPVGRTEFPETKGQPSLCSAVDVYRVGPDYEAKALAAVKQQLMKGGVRLAAVLRDGFK